jgi:signal transduction histidine kinase
MASTESASAVVSDDWIFGALRDTSEMCCLIRAIAWEDTSLGPLSSWPLCLKSALSICLTSRFPVAILLGSDSLFLYNDAYRPRCGHKHPALLGAPFREFWPEIYDILGPRVAGVMKTGVATWKMDDLLVMTRWGYHEETYWTYSYSPVLSPEGGGAIIHGVLAIAEDTTSQHLATRRLKTLRELSATLSEVNGVSETCNAAIDVFARNAYDAPFAALYLPFLSQSSSGQTRFRLQRSCAIPTQVSGVSPLEIEIPGQQSLLAAAFKKAIETPLSITLVDVPIDSGLSPLAPWDEVPRQFAVLPLGSGLLSSTIGVLLVGINTHRALDDDYKTFLTLAAAQVTSSILKARTYEEEKKRAEQLAELDRAKTLFFTNISHEFRTPLTLMLGPLEALLQQPESLTSAQRNSLELIYRNGNRLFKLVNALLDFSRIEAGRMQAQFAPTDLSVLTADLASVFSDACRRANLSLLVNCPPLSHEVYVDREMYEKIVLNLLSNAYKFTLSGEIEVRLQDDDEAGSGVCLMIRDTGCGIPQAEMPRLFERFHRIASRSCRTHEGSGIGLALVYELVRLHGGSVRASSAGEGLGSSFLVTLPYGSAHLSPQQLVVSARPRPPSELRSSFYVQSDGAQMSHSSELVQPLVAPTLSAHVLVADDNADMLGYVARILRDAGYEVTEACDGRQALECLLSAGKKEKQPDLVISDIMMPNLSGFELLSAIRSNDELCHIPVLFLSARAGQESSCEGLEAGADDYLCKPFSSKDLLARVSARIELSRQRKVSLQRERHLRLKAEQAEATKDRFLAVLSHELRTPLSPALLLVEQLLGDQTVCAAVRADLQIVVRQMRLQVNLIDDLLDVTKLRQGKVQLRKEHHIPIAPLVSQALEMSRCLAEEKRITLLLQTRDHDNVDADPARLQQIISNLLSNAIKFSPQNSSVGVRTWSEDRRLFVAVTDHGIGMDADLIRKLFQPFEQGGDQITRTFGGLGLGLFISYTLATLHGGSLLVESGGPGKGSTVTLSLPLSLASPRHHTTSNAEDCVTKPLSMAPSLLRVFLVEDNAATALIMRRLLQRLGHEVLAAASCQEAVKLASDSAKRRFDLLLCDVGLPDGDGCSLLPMLLPFLEKAYCVALTGYGQDADRRKTLDAGFHQHLTKPVSMAQLEAVIKEASRRAEQS